MVRKSIQAQPQKSWCRDAVRLSFKATLGRSRLVLRVVQTLHDVISRCVGGYV